MTDWEIFKFVFRPVLLIFIGGSLTWFIGYVVNIWRDRNEK